MRGEDQLDSRIEVGGEHAVDQSDELEDGRNEEFAGKCDDRMVAAMFKVQTHWKYLRGVWEVRPEAAQALRRMRVGVARDVLPVVVKGLALPPTRARCSLRMGGPRQGKRRGLIWPDAGDGAPMRCVRAAERCRL